MGRLGQRGQGRLARLLAGLLWRFQRHRREEMLQLMQQSFGTEYTEEALQELRRKAYLNMGWTLAEFLRLPSLRPEQVVQMVQLEGEEILQEALSAGRGAIILTAHFGNWELLGARLAKICGEGKFHVIAQPQRDHQLTKLLNDVRQRHGVNVISRGRAAREALAVLRRGEVLGILMDVDMKEQGCFVDFLWRKASLPTGPAAFALRTGAAVLPIFTERQSDGTHCAQIEAPMELTRSGDRDRDLQENTARFAQVVERQIRTRPEQWIWLPSRWRTPPPANNKAGSKI